MKEVISFGLDQFVKDVTKAVNAGVYIEDSAVRRGSHYFFQTSEEELTETALEPVKEETDTNVPTKEEEVSEQPTETPKKPRKKRTPKSKSVD